MSDLLIGDLNVSQRLREIFEQAEKGWITLIQVPIENAQTINLESILILQSLGYKGMYISLSKDFFELKEIMGAKGIDINQIVVVDGVSEMYGTQKAKNGNVRYVEGPLSISNILAEVETFAKEDAEDKKFVFLDSITTVLMYNSLDRTVNFGSTLIKLTTKLDMVGVLVSVSSGITNIQMVDELSKVSTQTIDFRESI